MHFHFPTAVLAVLPLATGESFQGPMNNPDTAALAIRAADAANIVTLPVSTSQPFFQITSFSAFLPSEQAAANPRTGYSRARFDLRLMHPVKSERWGTTCFVHTLSTLCGPNAWNECEQIPGKTKAKDSVRFRLNDDVSGIEIQRVWDYKGAVMTVYAQEGANWVAKKSVGAVEGNVTVTDLGRWFEKKDAWVLPWKAAVA